MFGFTCAVVKLLVLNMYKYILINEYTFLEESLFHTLLAFLFLMKKILFVLDYELHSRGSFHYHWVVNTRSQVLSPKEEV